MSLTTKYQANPIDAVMVTENNRGAIAEWTGGHTGTKGELHIKIGSGRTEREVIARVGHWVIKEYSGSFRVFNDKAFKRIFNSVDVPTIPLDVHVPLESWLA